MRWPETQLRHLSKQPITNGLGEAGDKGNPLDWPRYIRTTDIKDLLRLHGDRRVTLPAEKAALASVRKGDILMTAAGATVGKSFQYCETETACYAGYLVRWRVTEEIALPRYMAYWTESKHFSDQIATGLVKSTIENFSASKYRSMRAPTPPLDEQQAIADYLDHETQRIDELIAEQRSLIETLRERRSAAITVLTWGGLDNSVPRETSGVEPAPLAPSHWKRSRNKQIFFESKDTSAGGAEELLSVSHLTGVTPRSEKNVTMTEAESLQGYRIVEPADLVINTMWAWMGALGVSQVSGIVSPAYGVYRPIDASTIEPRYFDHLVRSSPYVSEMTRNSRGVWSSRLRLYPDVFLRMPIVVPPLNEQRAIADALDDQTIHIDALIAESEDLIALSLERRAALITATVTGQIDVRTTA